MQKQEGNTLACLMSKIHRLRKRLISYGWNKQESNDFILQEFLKLPSNHWQSPSSTLDFYKIKEKYQVEASPAELILQLQQILPNLQQEDVLDYLHSVFQYSAMNFGFELFESSSDSGENPLILKKHLKKQRPLRHRPTIRQPSPPSRKKVHRGNEEYRQLEKEQQRSQQIRLIRKRKTPKYRDCEQWEKGLKKDEFD